LPLQTNELTKVTTITSLSPYKLWNEHLQMGYGIPRKCFSCFYVCLSSHGTFSRQYTRLSYI